MTPAVAPVATSGGTTTPSTHCAWATTGTAGVTTSHDASANVTTNVAVVGVRRVQAPRLPPPASPRGVVGAPRGVRAPGLPPQPTPSASVAVTVTDWPGREGSAGSTV